MNIYRIAVLALTIPLFQTSGAQSRTLNQANQVVKTANDIKNLFGRRNHRSEPDYDTVQSGRNKLNERVKAGGLAFNAKFLDVDEMFDFSQGAAVVRKGTSCALIDSSGSFIVPFNKYIIRTGGVASDGPLGHYHHGVFKVREIGTNREGYLNTKGVFYPFTAPNSSYSLRMLGDLIAVEMYDQPSTYIDNACRKYTIKNAFMDFREGLGVVCASVPCSYSIKKGYKNLNDQFVIQPQFEYADAFYEGFAIVGQLNEYNRMKYGFIDKTGKEIFPCVLSVKPSRFSSGFARIEPKDKSEFDYAYINKLGGIGIKLKNTQGMFGDFYNGYAFSIDNKCLDTTGKIITLETLCRKFGINPTNFYGSPSQTASSLLYGEDMIKEKINYVSTVRLNPNENRQVCGFIDIKTKKVVDAVFELDRNNRTASENIRFDTKARPWFYFLC